MPIIWSSVIKGNSSFDEAPKVRLTSSQGWVAVSKVWGRSGGGVVGQGSGGLCLRSLVWMLSSQAGNKSKRKSRVGARDEDIYVLQPAAEHEGKYCKDVLALIDCSVRKGAENNARRTFRTNRGGPGVEEQERRMNVTGDWEGTGM